MKEQCYGLLYGYYREDPSHHYGIRAVCEGIYEPHYNITKDYLSIDNRDNLVESLVEHLCE